MGVTGENSDTVLEGETDHEKKLTSTPKAGESEVNSAES